MHLLIAKRLTSGIVLVFVVAIITHALLYQSGGEIARRLLGTTADPETVARKQAELGLDRPWIEQFWSWLTSALTGDLGRSWLSGQQVTDGIVDRLPVTLSLVFATMLVTVVVAVVLGVVAAQHGGWIDGLIQWMSVLALALPGFLIAVWLVLVFAVKLSWLPATGYTPVGESFAGWAASITLPVAALSISAVAGVAQQVRGSVLDVISRDYIRTLRSRGLGMKRVLYRHVLRNAAGPSLTILGLQFVGLLGGTVFVEQIFALPGIGQFALTATLATDIPVVMAIVVVTTAVVCLVNFAIDVAHVTLNPKARS